MNYGSVSRGSCKMYQDRPVKLLNRLDELDITRKAFAETAGVSERSVYDWLSYRKEPKLTFLQVAAVCNLLRWTVQDLAEAYYPHGDGLSTESPGQYSPN